MQFLFNFDGQTVLDKVLSSFEESDSVDIAVGFIGLDGLNRIKDPVKSLIDRGGSFRLIAGMHGVRGTSLTFDQLKALWDLNNYKRRRDGEERIKLSRDRAYHGKVYLFSDNDSSTVLIGSSNLSNAGLASRLEANAVIEGGANSPDFTVCKGAVDKLWSISGPLSEQNITVVALPRAQRLGEEEAIATIEVEDPKLEEAKRTVPHVFTITENNLSEGGRPRINEAYLNANKAANEFFGGKDNVFQVITDDRHTFQAQISGYGANPEIGKNLRSTPSNKEMGLWLKVRKDAVHGDIVKAYRIPGEQNTFLFEFERARNS